MSSGLGLVWAPGLQEKLSLNKADTRNPNIDALKEQEFVGQGST